MIPRRSTALVALLLLLAGCSVSRVEEERPVPFVDRPAPSRTAPEVKVRRVEVGVPRWYDQPYVDFGDRSHGYALFASCGGKPPAPDCPALLYATENAGRSWHRVAHPRPFAQRQRLQVIFDVPALLVAADGWYFRSTTAAASGTSAALRHHPSSGRCVARSSSTNASAS